MSLTNGFIEISLPSWLVEGCEDRVFENDTSKMEFVIELTRRNIEEGGGPFGACVFDMDTGKLISCGVNLVLQNNISVLHAEVVAFMVAQSKLKSYSLAKAGNFELFSSSEPCIMCMGACLWSGIKRLVYGASAEYAKRIGFDEGPISKEHWDYLRAKGVDVVGGFMADRVEELLEAYSLRNGVIYNP